MDARPKPPEAFPTENLQLQQTLSVTSHYNPTTKDYRPITSHYRKPVLVKILAQKSNLSTVEVNRVLDNLNIIVERHLMPGAVGHFTLPRLFKVKKKRQTVAGEKTINPSVDTSNNYVSDHSEPYVLEFHAAKALRDSIQKS